MRDSVWTEGCSGMAWRWPPTWEPLSGLEDHWSRSEPWQKTGGQGSGSSTNNGRHSVRGAMRAVSVPEGGSDDAI